ncbi:MAG: sulfotransferase [Salinibacter sp.]
MPRSLRPVLIIGAARSGTKVLRRMLAASPHCAVVPYGIPAVWKQGNESHPNDALPRTACSDETAKRIRRTITQLADGSAKASLLVEKTSANTLRVPFVQRVFPEARFIHLVRDGVDVVESARRRWQTRPGLAYLLRKALFLRWIGVRQGLRYLWRWGRNGGSESSRLWGPHYPGMKTDVAERPLLHVCALQWRACTKAALDALGGLSDDRVFSLRYETLVSNPDTVNRVADFMGISSSPSMQDFYQTTIHDSFVGRGRQRLSEEDQEEIRPILRSSQTRLGYPL